jgi:Fe-S-cluster-containing hydrogenase component 2
LTVNIDQSRCVGCGLCIEVCPTRALYNNKGKTGWHPEKCNSCAICDRICIVSALDFIKNG